MIGPYNTLLPISSVLTSFECLLRGSSVVNICSFCGKITCSYGFSHGVLSRALVRKTTYWLAVTEQIWLRDDVTFLVIDGTQSLAIARVKRDRYVSCHSMELILFGRELVFCNSPELTEYSTLITSENKFIIFVRLNSVVHFTTEKNVTAYSKLFVIFDEFPLPTFKTCFKYQKSVAWNFEMAYILEFLKLSSYATNKIARLLLCYFGTAPLLIA